MTPDERPVKGKKAGRKPVFERCMSYIDRHPRLGWYVAFMSTINVLLTLAQIYGVL